MIKLGAGIEKRSEVGLRNSGSADGWEDRTLEESAAGEKNSIFIKTAR